MPSDSHESETPVETNEGAQASPTSSGLSDTGIQAMQGSLEQTGLDTSKLEYRLRSPHSDYTAYKGLQKAKRQHEIGQQAATADSLPDAIDTTLAAHGETHSEDEMPMDQYFREKYGSAPYTEAAYPDDEDG